MPKITINHNQTPGAISIEVPLISRGKFRCKTRHDIQDFGKSFAPKQNPITEDVYLEWQIGYDTPINDAKETELNSKDFVFIGANNKEKYPYELSEILYFMCQNKIISESEIRNLQSKIAATKTYLQDAYPIQTKKEDPTTFNNAIFLTSSTKLPTFITGPQNCKLKIEIMIQKQQYATGTQPMLYLIIPMNAFDNSKDIINNTSSQVPYGQLSFDKTMKDLIFQLVFCFGMLSASHNHDIQEILKIIIAHAF